jgi:hypothetical protein
MREVTWASRAEKCANISNQNAHAGGLKLQQRTIHQLRNTILEDFDPLPSISTPFYYYPYALA